MCLKATTVMVFVTTCVVFGIDQSFAQNSTSALVIEPKAIYGDDDRIEVTDADELHRNAAQSVAALVSRPTTLAIGLGSTDSWTLSDRPTLRDDGWCDNEPFSDQPTAAFCTGFLIDEDKLVTSAHCAYDGRKDKYKAGELCSNIAVVFDYKISDKNSFADDGRPLNTQQLYFCDSVVSAHYDRAGSDWAVLQLDRPVTGRQPLAVYTELQFEENASISVIGHPLGLPAKVSTNARVLEQSRSDYVITNLDTYDGNSGSPVFVSVIDEADAGEKLMVIGILSRGERDEELVAIDDNTTCKISRQCDALTCKGEHVTRITELPRF